MARRGGSFTLYRVRYKRERCVTAPSKMDGISQC
nr:MAG TPA: hypothetical protein [Caudoviricetes sp.]